MMKNIFFVLSVVLFVTGLAFLFRASLKYHVYKNARDASPRFYKKKYAQAKTYLIVGTALIIAGIVTVLVMIPGVL